MSLERKIEIAAASHWLASGSGPYRSPFKGWNDRAAVRATPQRRLETDFCASQAFPDAMTPVLGLLNVTFSDEQRSFIKAQHLYRFLSFTTTLEQLVVNRTVSAIAHGAVGVRLPSAMRLDAYRIYVDEGYHALFSADLAEQLYVRTGIDPIAEHGPKFENDLMNLINAPGADVQLIETLFVIVSETLVTAALLKVSNHQGVASSVAALMNDHAVDERRHHAYFRSFAKYFWWSLSESQRQVAADVLPELICIFTAPDIEANRRDLRHVGMGVVQTEEILREAFPADRIRAAAVASSIATVSYFVDLGILRYQNKQLLEFARACEPIRSS